MIGHVNSQQGIARGKLLAVLFVTLALVVAGVAFMTQGNQPQQGDSANPTGYRTTADQFIKLISGNKADASFALMTEAGKKDVGGIDKWREIINTSFAKSKAKPVFVSDYPLDDPSGVYNGKQPKFITYRLEMFDATWETSLTIIKDGGSWKVDRIGTELRQ